MGAVAAADLDPVEAAAAWAWGAAVEAVQDLMTEAWEVLPLAEALAPVDPEWEVQAAKWKVSKDWLELTLIGMKKGTFHPLVFFGSDFDNWVFLKNFQTFLDPAIAH